MYGKLSINVSKILLKLLLQRQYMKKSILEKDLLQISYVNNSTQEYPYTRI